MTETRTDAKFRREILVGRYVANPVVRGMFKVGLTPPFHTIIETTGRKSGLARRLPVVYGRFGGTVWLISQHGLKAGWVINLRADPRVRLLLDGTWVEGRAFVEPGDDVRARAATFSDNPILRKIILATYVALETRPMSVRVELV